MPNFEIKDINGVVVNRVVAEVLEDISLQEGQTAALMRPMFERNDVASEAERRIDAGTQINDIQFCCDDKSLRRLTALLRSFERGVIGPEGKTYETKAGTSITFRSKEDVELILNVAEDFESAMLERSAQIQRLSAIPDPSQDFLWNCSQSLSELLSATD
ncbi:hypothetical protein [Pseudovibrio brasiliensis]|uniref:Uncharacterized protein n=1 Tax=Pseudovibrio brasiliensis TaxID=1898042 RepID=A0ABX8B186_9HYPH|nr:hypothetical protein [Pseudovibrio brasiliensis]QUS59216.1 hypothetical protein KGB56_26905 [Pseudovibrio brasiliensis]